jgi:hypothetical protein
MIMNVHIDISPIKGCKCPEDTYGMLCVKCNKCGRFDERKCERCRHWLLKSKRCKIYHGRKEPCKKFDLLNS